MINRNGPIQKRLLFKPKYEIFSATNPLRVPHIRMYIWGTNIGTDRIRRFGMIYGPCSGRRLLG